MSGLTKDKKTGKWLVDKFVLKQRLRAAFDTKTEAERWMTFKSEAIHQEATYGIRPPMTFEAAASRRLAENMHMPSAVTTAYLLNAVIPYTGHLEISKISDQSFDEYRRRRAEQGMSAKTIRLELQAAKSVLNDAANKWKTTGNISFLEKAPHIEYPSLVGQQRRPHPLSWAEQVKLIKALPYHLKCMAEFGIYTGARDDVICNLKWAWKLDLPELNSYVFRVPREHVKGKKEERILILSSKAKEIVEAQEGRHDIYVFSYRRERTKNLSDPPAMKLRPIRAMTNTAWVNARKRAGLSDLHVHDLRHTFATRLGQVGVDQKTIADLMWHSPASVTARYTSALVSDLEDAVELIATPSQRVSVSLASLMSSSRT